MPATYTDLQQAYFDHLERVIPFIGFSDEVSGKAVEFLWKELLGDTTSYGRMPYANMPATQPKPS